MQESWIKQMEKQCLAWHLCQQHAAEPRAFCQMLKKVLQAASAGKTALLK